MTACCIYESNRFTSVSGTFSFREGNHSMRHYNIFTLHCIYKSSTWKVLANFITNRQCLLQVWFRFHRLYTLLFLITYNLGATGFLGKVLVEKLLRSCTTIKRVYILIRKKNGKPALERFQNILKGKIFNRLREENPVMLDKLDFLEGNIEEQNLGNWICNLEAIPEIFCLGISEDDLTTITTTVNIVFHMAATVRFNDDLKEAGLLNVLATKTLFDLCLKIDNLKVCLWFVNKCLYIFQIYRVLWTFPLHIVIQVVNMWKKWSMRLLLRIWEGISWTQLSTFRDINWTLWLNMWRYEFLSSRKGRNYIRLEHWTIMS